MASHTTTGNTARPTIMQVIDDPEQCMLFQQFLAERYCDESLAFVLDVRAFKQLPPASSKQRDMAYVIWDKYIKSNGAREISFDCDDKRIVDKAIDASDISSTMFDGLATWAMDLLRNDCFDRFLQRSALRSPSVESAKQSNTPVSLSATTKRKNPAANVQTTTSTSSNSNSNSSNSNSNSSKVQPAGSYAPLMWLAAPFALIMLYNALAWLF
jgi:hypothetical protein